MSRRQQRCVPESGIPEVPPYLLSQQGHHLSVPRRPCTPLSPDSWRPAAPDVFRWRLSCRLPETGSSGNSQATWRTTRTPRACPTTAPVMTATRPRRGAQKRGLQGSARMVVHDFSSEASRLNKFRSHSSPCRTRCIAHRLDSLIARASLANFCVPPVSFSRQAEPAARPEHSGHGDVRDSPGPYQM